MSTNCPSFYQLLIFLIKCEEIIFEYYRKSTHHSFLKSGFDISDSNALFEILIKVWHSRFYILAILISMMEMQNEVPV